MIHMKIIWFIMKVYCLMNILHSNSRNEDSLPDLRDFLCILVSGSGALSFLQREKTSFAPVNQPVYPQVSALLISRVFFYTVVHPIKLT